MFELFEVVAVFLGPCGYEVRVFKQPTLPTSSYVAPRLTDGQDSVIVWRAIRTGKMIRNGLEVDLPPDVRNWLRGIEGNLK